MITLSWKEINEPEFVNGVVKLNNSRDLDGKSSYRVGRIFEACKKATIESSKIEKEMRAKYCLFDEQGNELGFRDEGAKAEFDKAMEELFLTNTIEVKAHKIDFTALMQAKGLSGTERVAIASITADVPDVA